MMKYFDDFEFNEAIRYIEAIFTLGGLSECGKTSAGIYLEELPYQIKRYKIIHIEKQMMEARGYNLTDGMKDEHFQQLYSSLDCEDTFKEFIVRLVKRMKLDNVKRASIESLYRAPFGEFLKNVLGERCANIYIDAPVELRARRQWEKKCMEEGAVSLDYITNIVKEKDIFKEIHKASECKTIADYVVDNGENISKDKFLAEIKMIALNTINTNMDK